MRSDAILACVAFGAVALTVSGCSKEAAPTPPPAFMDNTGEAKNTLTYPAGPYGIGIGSTIANYDFVGYANAKATTSSMQAISLSDFYNPHGKDPTYKPASPAEDDRLFPAGSGYAAQAKPTVLLIDIASVWCGPCNQEAGTILPMKHLQYAACGGEFLLDLHDSNTPGTTATPNNLYNWTKSYRVDYPAAIDPSYKLDQVFAADAFPNNVTLDTTTMKIVDVVAGESITGICSDQSALCGTDADLALCNDTSKGLNCNGLSACAAPATCQQDKFWTTFESLLDKTRPGCTVK